MSRPVIRKIEPTADAGNEMLGPILQRYFCDYLINQRQLSPRTIATYRDTFRLMLSFFERCRSRDPDNLRLRDLDARSVLAFLDDLERERGNGARSRNLRLATIRSFMRYAAASDPLLLPIAQRILAIPTKRFERASVGYLTRRQMQLLLDSPDASTETGLRDRVLLTLLYNTGARVSEIAALRVADLRLDTGGSVHIQGKGRKERAVPLWRATVRLLRAWLRRNVQAPEAPLLPNAHGRPMTRWGIEQRLRVAVKRTAARDPSITRQRVSPHTIRHTTAMHLLQSGVDLSVIAMWLGHESIETTHQYLNADLDSKRRALDHLEAPTIGRRPRRPRQQIREFLAAL